MKSSILAALAAIIMLGCGRPKMDTSAEGEKVMQTSRDWAKAAAAADIEKTLSYWTDDAVLMSPGQPTLNGKKQIRQMVEGSFKMPGFKISWEPQSVQVSPDGDMAYLIEKSQITMKDSTGKSVTQHLNGVTIWRKQSDGSWKDAVDIGSN